ncbi:SAM-dependent methyltransferase [Rhodobacteraceae bacterium WD3A24]|nr:SAM-dependent methyltransferase [Rhodobacteraceae bacterium WD3A24]
MWERLLDRMMARLVRRGTLTVHLPDGQVLRHGGGAPEVAIRVSDPAVVRGVVLNPELAVGEAYMEGTLTIDDDDLHGFLGLALGNMAETGGTRWTGAMQSLRKLLRTLRQYNPASRARQNVAHHYDLSGELYDLFLDDDKQYSCGYFRSPSDTLEQAQAQKKAHIAGKLLIEPGMRVLDIGCGWGGLALTLARDFGARVVGVTLSTEQYNLATDRARRAGLSDRVEFRLQDYRDVLETFDRIVSVGMFEHVGTPHYRAYFGGVRDRLTEDGVALIHTIGRADPPGTTNPWIAKYIFPGGYIPAMSETMRAIEKERLWPTDVEVWRLHYAETLRHWHDRFMANIDRARAIYDERFCRMWRFYLAASEMTFRASTQCVFQFQLSRRVDAVPLTRDYLYTPRPAAAVGSASSAAE